MAHNVEPMDIDNIEGDFDNKENSLHHSNVLPRTPCTEKGYEELDVSELNMKLRYSITPASSPMSKSYTAHCLDNRNSDCSDNSIENANLTRSFNSMLTKNDNISKSTKLQPLQLHTAEQSLDNNRISSVLRTLDSTVTDDTNNITVTVTDALDTDENLSLPSSSSSALHTPEATTPTKEISKSDGGSPIMRGLKSVLNMFRASQSPIPTAENEDNIVQHDISSPVDVTSPSSISSDVAQVALASTPIAARNKREPSSKRGSPHKESIVFNEDLEKELLWKDETTILFSEEKIPIHKLFFQQSKNIVTRVKEHDKVPTAPVADVSLNETLEFMDISYNDSLVKNKTVTELTDVTQVAESDSEFVDCETTFTNDDKKVDDPDMESSATFLSDVSGNTLNKTAQELQMSANRKEVDNVSLTNELPVTVTQDIVGVSGKGICDDIISTESESERKLYAETPNEHLNGSTFILKLQSCENPLSSSTFNVTQDIKTQNDVSQPLNATVIVENEDKLELSSPVIQNVREDSIKPLDATVSIESNYKPMSVSTFIMNTTQNITPFSLATVEDMSVPAHILSTDNKNVQLNVTQDLEEKHISSSTFIMNTSQFIQSQPETVNEYTNATVTTSGGTILVPTGINNVTQVIDDHSNLLKKPLDVTISFLSSDKSAESSTLVLNAIQDGETFLASNKDNKLLDTIITVDSTENPASSTFIKDNTQDIGLHMSRDTDQLLDSENNSGIELSDITITTESAQILASSTISRDLTNDAKGEVAGQNKNIFNTIEMNKETCITSEFLDRTLSTNTTVASEDSNCKKQEIMDQPIEISREYDGDLSIHRNFASETQNSDISKPTDVTMSVAASEAAITNIQYTPKENSQFEIAVTDIESKDFVDYEKNQIVIDQDQVQENFKDNNHEIQSVKPDILHSTGDAAKLLINETERKVIEFDSTDEVIKPLENKRTEEFQPVHIPLPDEDDIELEPLSTDQHASENNAVNSNGLPAVVNNLESLKIQDTNLIDNLPIISTDHVEAPADSITDTINIKSDVMNDDYKMITENNFIETNRSDQEKFIKPENVPNSTLSNEKDNIKMESDGSICLDSKLLESKSEQQLESMDISYQLEVNQNTTTTDHSQNNLNVPKETSDVSNGQCLDSHDIQAQSENEFIDYVKTAAPSNINTKTENETVLESVQFKPNTENHVDKVIHEEIIVSENNSPYVLVSVDKDVEIDNDKKDNSLEEDFEQIDNPFDSDSKISPPRSPPIASKGYNFNFDEIDDPFATKTKIRTSPPLDSPMQLHKSEENIKAKDPVKKSRKSYPVRAKSAITKKNFNNSSVSKQCTTNIINENNLDGDNLSNLNKANEVKENSYVSTEVADVIKVNVIEKSELEHNIDNTSKSIEGIQNEEKNVEDIAPVMYTLEVKKNGNKSPVTLSTPSSSDQSIYLSAATSSGDSITVRNVFNLPEIDDMNFNPFSTKSKLSLSPPPNLKQEEPNATDGKFDSQGKTENSNDKHVVDKSHSFSEQKSSHDEKDSSNASNTTCSSKDDKDTTVREVHTDDEDTIEGPFLDTEDSEMREFGLQNAMRNKELAGLDLQNDMMEFSNLPAQDDEENELFIDAAAYEFLLNQNKSNMVMDSGKESLFLKFDPLFAKRLSSEGIAAALSKIQKRQSTPKKISKPPPSLAEQAGPSTSKLSPQEIVTEEAIEDLNITTSKPMMVVTPAVNPIVKPRKSTTPVSSNRRSITFTSPAIAVIDRLLSLSANNSLVDQNTTITHVSREHEEAEMALTQLRELLAEKEINVYNLRSESKELKDRLLTLESQMKVLETESEARLKKVNELNEILTEKTKINKSMAAVVEEYERTIASLIAETEQDRKRHDDERARLIKERDEQTAHLASMEVSFSDLHSKYEKSKQIILSCKANEDTYKKSIKDFEENLTKMQNNYELLKQHATSKLNHANQELEKMNRAHESEVLKLNAMIKRKELHITSLEETLAQKTKANEELTAICDELINKVG
ncbi:putative leucine-rich repeat-containing protein DDB_G0290503 [Plodia interpunctella]|uniref:putative leucine-rich repeat-containing protein DDB_G0290503 n=1 Tax=Plodia interpunctella TaxID=58824 RepID=UPI002368D122|nr:putative leucine-rich repeat-containing protein DDB_G0290503 [Plodia interpunctella]